MTPSNSLTMEGFLRGLQGEMMGLIASTVIILIVWFLVRWFIKKSADDAPCEETDLMSRWANRIAGVLIFLVIVGFAINAATYSTNAIPHSDLDRSSIDQQMNSNIKQP